jgi:hypothetical protein
MVITGAFSAPDGSDMVNSIIMKAKARLLRRSRSSIHYDRPRYCTAT